MSGRPHNPLLIRHPASHRKPAMSDPVVDHLLARHDAILEDLKILLRMPRVSADPAFV